MKTGPGSDPETNSSAPRSRSAVRAVFLVGFMGAGKSSVGRTLARQMDWAFEDLDTRVQSREQRTIEQIFREVGEGGFRRAEHEALRELLAETTSSPRVIALGGGAFVQPQNAALLNQADVPTVFLDAPVEELFRRCQEEPVERPLRRSVEEFRNLYLERRPHYLRAGLRIETGGKDVETVATEVARSLGLKGPGVKSQGVVR